VRALREWWQQRWEARWRALINGRYGFSGAMARGCLRVLSWPYAWGVGLRNWLYDHGWLPMHAVDVPVISVGNLSLGGTGKTPCIEYIARYYRRMGYRVAIVSRGYNATSDRNDEALVLEENLPDVPHLQNVNRVAAVECAINELESQIILLDDGFQHRRLFRNIDIVLLDASKSVLSDYLFPRGTLREPLSSLQRASCIVLTRCDQSSPEQLTELRQALISMFPKKKIISTIHQPTCLRRYEQTIPLNKLKQRPIAAFCGIGNPDAFRRTLLQLGTVLLGFRIFSDHHIYTQEDIESLYQWIQNMPNDIWIITTQKDWVKLRIGDIGDRQLWTINIEIKIIDREDEFHEILDRVITKVNMCKFFNN
jgi:tetraacyldisaccharide 4'-kinase